MILTPELDLFLKVGSGVLWTAVYAMIIRRNFIERTYGMPIAALCANLAWEFLFSFVTPHPQPQLTIDRIWFGFDLVLLAQTLRFGRSGGLGKVPHPFFVPLLFGFLGFAIWIIYTLTLKLPDPNGVYSAFSQNLMMSILFIFFLRSRPGVEGQSLWIGLAKGVGTLLPSIKFHLMFPEDVFLHFLFVSILFFDALYCWMIHRKLRQLGVSPWKKF